jgi:hypothetical protein
MPLSSVRVCRIPAGMNLKARTAAQFKVAALLSGIIWASSIFVFRSTNVDIKKALEIAWEYKIYA